LQDPPKFAQIWIFGLKANHLATLLLTDIKIALIQFLSVVVRVTRRFCEKGVQNPAQHILCQKINVSRNNVAPKMVGPLM
jgi:hypothetical protein